MINTFVNISGNIIIGILHTKKKKKMKLNYAMLIVLINNVKIIMKKNQKENTSFVNIQLGTLLKVKKMIYQNINFLVQKITKKIKLKDQIYVL